MYNSDPDRQLSQNPSYILPYANALRGAVGGFGSPGKLTGYIPINTQGLTQETDSLIGHYKGPLGVTAETFMDSQYSSDSLSDEDMSEVTSNSSPSHKTKSAHQADISSTRHAQPKSPRTPKTTSTQSHSQGKARGIKRQSAPPQTSTAKKPRKERIPDAF